MNSAGKKKSLRGLLLKKKSLCHQGLFTLKRNDKHARASVILNKYSHFEMKVGNSK